MYSVDSVNKLLLLLPHSIKQLLAFQSRQAMSSLLNALAAVIIRVLGRTVVIAKSRRIAKAWRYISGLKNPSSLIDSPLKSVPYNFAVVHELDYESCELCL